MYKVILLHLSKMNNNIFAKMKFANILLNMGRKCDNISLKGGNGEWKNYQH